MTSGNDNQTPRPTPEQAERIMREMQSLPGPTRRAKSMPMSEINYLFTNLISYDLYATEFIEYGRPRFAFTSAAAELLRTHDELDPQCCLDCIEGACDQPTHNSQDGE